MDFLKTILAYVTLLTTLGVQEGPAPQTVPTPSPLPAHVTASPVPHQTAAPTSTPAPTPDPTPAMTANKRYAKLAFGDSGTNVRKLQNELIKLGYMPSGSADSQYGYQTLNAVKAFQRANGLSADGVAGPITLTHLYENPAVIGVTVATEVPTATPTPPLPSLPTMDPTSAAAQQSPAALLTRMEGAYVISGADGKTLYYETQVNDVPALVKLDMWVDADGTPVLSLPQLAGALGWNLMGSAADGLYALHACGYTVSIHIKGGAASVLTDGQPITVAAADALLQDDTLYVTDAFLRAALKAVTVYDADEKSLVLFLQDKAVANAND